MDNFVPIDTPTVKEPPVQGAEKPAARPEQYVEAIPPAEIIAERGWEKAVDGFENHGNRALETMREFSPRKETPPPPEKKASEPPTPPETPAKKGPGEDKKPLIAGKYKSYEDLEKGYKELEKRFHDPERTRKARERELRLQEENEILKREIELRSKIKDFSHEAPDDVKLNEAIARDPASAIKAELDRRELARDLHDQERLKALREDELRQSITVNVKYLEGNYPEFQENRQAFADWLSDLGADTNSICSDRERLERTYGEFVASQKSLEDFALEQREAGAKEALEKHGQVPPARGNELPPPPDQRMPKGDSRFQPIGGPEVPTDLTRPDRTIEDPLEAMESYMGIGRRPASMW
jgi:hypothetical protein